MNPNGNPLVQEVGLDLDTCLKTGRAVWTFGHTPYRIYPINTRSRRGKEKSICILQLVRRLSLLHREYVPIKKYVQLAACYRTPLGTPDARHFFWQVRCCLQPFVRFTQRLDHLFYAWCFSLFRPKQLRRPVASFQIFKELSALIAEYICIISRLFSASSANLNFDKNKKAAWKFRRPFYWAIEDYPLMSANNAFLISLKVL